MNIFKKYNIKQALIFSILTLVLLFVTFSFVYVSQKSNYIDKKYKQAEIRLSEFSNFIKVFHNVNKVKLVAAERITTNFFNVKFKITEEKKDTIEISALIKNSNNIETFKVTTLKVDKKAIYKNLSIVEELRHITSAYVSVYQKTTDGYVMITSNIPSQLKVETVPIYLHNSSSVVQNIEKGIKFFKRDFVRSGTRMSIYRPLFINGNIKGIIEVSYDEELSFALNSVYSNDENYKKGMFFYTDINGKSLIKTKQFIDLKNSVLFKKMKLKHAKVNKTDHRIIINNKVEYLKIIYSYLRLTDSYTGVFVFDSESNQTLSTLQQNLIIIFIILWILMVTIFTFFILPLLKDKKRVVSEIDKILDFDIDKKVEVKDKETAQKILSVKKFITDIEQSAQEVQDESYNEKADEKKLKIDNIFNNLSKKIQRVNSKLEENQKETELRNKLNEGSKKLNTILQHSTDIDKLSNDIIKNVVNFLEIEQGGIFVVNDENPEEQFLEMKAHFAYNKDRLAEKIIPVNTGLLGRAVLEKESIYMTELPENYTKIESGFGEREPKSLAIIPLIFTNNVLGVIEIASENEIEPYKIEFLENFGENIASAFSNIKITKKTQELLSKTQHQAKEIETQRLTLQEKIDTHRRQNRVLDKSMLELSEIVKSIKYSLFVMEYDLNGILIDANSRILKLLDIKLETIIEHKHENIISAENYKQDYVGFWKDLKSGKIKRSKELFKFNEKETILNNTYIPVRNARGRIYRILAISTDM